MAVSADPGHFFQTTASLQSSSLRAAASSNTLGLPVHFPSKPLAIIPGPSTGSNTVYIAESAGSVRIVTLGEDEKGRVLRSDASTAPLTSLAVSFPTATVFAGSWDKSIHSWSLVTRHPLKRLVGGHTDFVKCLLVVPLKKGEKTEDRGWRDLLLSGGTDGRIVVWDFTTFEEVGGCRTGHRTGGVLAMAIDPSTLPTAPSQLLGGSRSRHEQDAGQEQGPVIIYSAGSDRTIRRYELSIPEPWNGELVGLTEVEPDNPIIAHETSVSALVFAQPSVNDDADGRPKLWTASLDGTAKCLSLSHSQSCRSGHNINTTPENNFNLLKTLNHNSAIRTLALDPETETVITAGRDEKIKIWDAESGELVGSYEGHYEEIVGLAIISGEVLSISLDGTVRRWSLKGEDIERERVRQAKAGEKGKGEEEEEGSLMEEESGKTDKRPGLMTEEEERELEELMSED